MGERQPNRLDRRLRGRDPPAERAVGGERHLIPAECARERSRRAQLRHGQRVGQHRTAGLVCAGLYYIYDLLLVLWVLLSVLVLLSLEFC